MFKRNNKLKNLSKERRLITHLYPKSTISEQFRMLRSNIMFSSIDHDIKKIVVTSAAPEAGKSTVAANVAVAYAQADKKVLLLDGDLRKPTVQHTFAAKNVFGLSNLITDQITIENAVQNTQIENLSIMTSGPIPPNPSELLASNRFKELFLKFESQFDIIIVDTPPVLAVTDAVIMSTLSDGAIIVTNVETNNKHHLIKAKELLSNSEVNLLGIVLNNVDQTYKDNYYYYEYNSNN
ncbi:CpsD/CapB family tyrosine-protein kinase [Macrococcoides caseolyticum]|uniref:CpsD/CapB family tyrosine-protein kinase n=1 Tax=Macrococcoides caseolyticum TaxID=69966 RepID=UPI000C33FD91|nr:CpsD/CapB family tyrosine-protein kinase [Macrococcus caseolyticus]PKD99978.1 capsular biosynthesis protein [Macrococcus caseolyticus]PKE62159.1 capsular biosynthesis protein [Macrococcus caseolyticus]PKF20063.1 capsular biosynthesis protein [Macrococcus caseolyticus]